VDRGVGLKCLLGFLSGEGRREGRREGKSRWELISYLKLFPSLHPSLPPSLPHLFIGEVLPSTRTIDTPICCRPRSKASITSWGGREGGREGRRVECMDKDMRRRKMSVLVGEGREGGREGGRENVPNDERR